VDGLGIDLAEADDVAEGVTPVVVAVGIFDLAGSLLSAHDVSPRLMGGLLAQNRTFVLF
jgi:hypothetical protein